MEFKQALSTLNRYFKLKQTTIDVYQILIDKELNEQNLCFLALKDINGIAYLTDYGTTCELVQTDEQILKAICEKNGVVFNNFKVECPFNSTKDIEKMLLAFDEIMQSNN